jgi:hypothetical protein
MGLHVKWALALVLTSGCNQVFGLDPPASAAEDADARDHDAIDIDAENDRDMDGVRDEDDDCPDAADPQQFDEDGDGRGDRCDLCPHLDQPDDKDEDEDQIPDACDPYPALSAGRLRFSGFHTSDDLLAWNASGNGAFEVVDDAAHLMPLLDGEQILALREDDDNPRTRTRVIADLEFEAPNTGTSLRRAAGLVTNMDPEARTTLFLCQLETDLPVIDVRLAEYRFDAGAATPLAVATVSSAYPSGHVRLELDVGVDGENPSTYGPRCQVDVGGATHALLRTTTTGLEPGLSGVRTVGIPLRVNWIVIIDHP